MSDADPAILRTYINTIDAELAKSALEAVGITAAVRSDDCGGMRPHMQMRGVDLLVRAEDVADAAALLDSAQDAAPADTE